MGEAMVVLETPRLVVRDHLESDLAGLTALLASPEEMRYLPELFARDADAAKRNLAAAIAEQDNPARSKFFFAIEEKASGRYVGEVGFTVEQTTRSGSLADLGYFMLREFHGKGYMTEAGKRVVEFAFAEAGVHKIKTGCLKENKASERVMRKLGFLKEGELRAHQYHEGVWKDRVVYGLLKTDALPTT